MRLHIYIYIFAKDCKVMKVVPIKILHSLLGLQSYLCKTNIYFHHF